MPFKKEEHISINTEFKKEHIPWNKGLTKETDERIRKMSEQNVSTRFKKGEHPSAGWKKGQISWNKGKKRHWYSPSQFKKGEKRVTGENNHNWKGGVTPLRKRVRESFEYRQWRSDVFTRDDFTCQKCNRRGCRLHAHHKKAFSDIMFFNDIKTYEQAMDCDELWNINNGITYCKECHFDEQREKYD